MQLTKTLRLLADEGRLRILRLLRAEELSVAELQEVLGMGQSRISMQLAQLKSAGLVEVRRAGQKSLYRLATTDALVLQILGTADAADDDRALELVLRKRKDKLREYFNELAGRFGRNYVPGRSWKGLAEMLIRLLPPMEIADLGAGEGTVSLLLAQRAKRVIAIDHSEKMVEYGAEIARQHGVANIEYRLGDLEDVPIEDASVDVALFHQSLHHAMHPGKALEEAFRILRQGGTVVVMDLLRHRFEEAREVYADVWLGFSELELRDTLQRAGFTGVATSLVHREDESPHFETLLAVGCKN